MKTRLITRSVYLTLVIALVTLLAVPGLGSAPTVYAASVASEDFNSYPTGVLDGNNGGSGWSNQWIANAAAVVVDRTGSELTFTSGDGYTVDGGSRALQVTGNQTPMASRNIGVSQSGDVYISFLFQFEAGAITNNDFAVIYFNNTNGPAIGLKANQDGGGPLDLMTRTNGGREVYSTDIATGTTYLVVGRLWKSGGGNYDRYSLWVNPDYADSATPDVTSTNPSTINSVNAVVLRTATLTAGDVILFDEINVGTTWDDVVPSPVNNPPTADDDSASTSEDTPVIIDVLDGDTDSDGTIDPATVTITQNPGSGSITNINATTGEVTYSPNAGFSGIDTFKYTVDDNDGAPSNEATVTVTVNAAPPPSAGPYEPFEDYAAGALNGANGGSNWGGPWAATGVVSVLDNSASPMTYSGGDITLNGATRASVVTGSGDNLASRPLDAAISDNVVYISFLFRWGGPAVGGGDFFSICLNNGASCTFSAIPVIGVRTQQFLIRTEAVAGTTGTVVTPGQTYFLVGRLTNTNPGVNATYDRFELFIDPASAAAPGAADLTHNGESSVDAVSHIGVRTSGTDAADAIQVDEIRIGTSWADVVPQANAAPTAANDSRTTTAGNAVTIDLTANDSDSDGSIDDSSVSITQNPANGGVVNNGNGTATYTPDAGFTGTDSFKYTVNDDDGATSNEATVTVTVNAAGGGDDDDDDSGSTGSTGSSSSSSSSSSDDDTADDGAAVSDDTPVEEPPPPDPRLVIIGAAASGNFPTELPALGAEQGQTFTGQPLVALLYLPSVGVDTGPGNVLVVSTLADDADLVPPPPAGYMYAYPAANGYGYYELTGDIRRPMEACFLRSANGVGQAIAVYDGYFESWEIRPSEERGNLVCATLRPQPQRIALIAIP